MPGKNVVAVEARGATDGHNKGGLLAWVRVAGRLTGDTESLAGWKVTADDRPEWTTPGFDDSSWAVATDARLDNRPYRPYLVWLGEPAGPVNPPAFETGEVPNVASDKSVRDGNPSVKFQFINLSLQRDPNQDDRAFLRVDPAALPPELRGKVGVPRP